jgi:hypothetical protein
MFSGADFRPTATPNANTKPLDRVSKLDSDMWKSYTSGLRRVIFRGQKLDTKTQTFFTVPIGTAGIAAGSEMPQPVTNLGIFNIANQVPNSNYPVLIPINQDGYIERLSKHLNAI